MNKNGNCDGNSSPSYRKIYSGNCDTNGYINLISTHECAQASGSLVQYNEINSTIPEGCVGNNNGNWSFRASTNSYTIEDASSYVSEMFCKE